METVYGDSTHQKANANKNKYTDEEVEIMKKIYENDLLDEINRDREEHGKKPIKKNEKEELNFDEETGKLKRDIQTKHIKISKTDSESGCFHKGEKEKCFHIKHFAIEMDLYWQAYVLRETYMTAYLSFQRIKY